MNALTRACIAVMAALSFVSLPSAATAPAATPDWTITITTKRVDHYLDHKGSQLTPIVKSSVSYSQGTFANRKSALYEDFYFGNDHAIGNIKHHSLDLTPKSAGEIRLMAGIDGGMTEPEAYASANAMQRVFLDLYAKGCIMQHVTVPLDSFHAVLKGFYQNGFQAVPPVGSTDNVTPTVMWQIQSDPPGQSQRIMY